MARTKKQVLQATARKQQLHLQAEQKAARLAGAAGSVKKGKSAEMPSLVSFQNVSSHTEAIGRLPGRPVNCFSKKTKAATSEISEAGNPTADTLLTKALASQKPEDKAEVTPRSEVTDPEKTQVPLDLDQASDSSPPLVSGPVNFKKAKMTARKSTNSYRQAEARELLESLARAELPLETSKHEINVQPLPAKSGVSHQSARKSMLKHGYSKVTARKSYPKIKFCARKSFQDSLTLGTENPDTEVDDSSSFDSVSVFQSVQEAVITLPKSEKLPVALVCIKDIYRTLASEAEEESQNTPTETKTSPGHRARRLSGHQRTDHVEEKRKSPRRSPKGGKLSKNIFEQFQTVTTDDAFQPTLNKTEVMTLKTSDPKLESKKFASAMKVLRSVSEKIEGRKKKIRKTNERSPRKNSPRRNSVKESPKASEVLSRSSEKATSSSDDRVAARRRSGSCSPRGSRKMHSPSVNTCTAFIKTTQSSSPGDCNNFMLTLRDAESKTVSCDINYRTSPRNGTRLCVPQQQHVEHSTVVRELQFTEPSKEQGLQDPLLVSQTKGASELSSEILSSSFDLEGSKRINLSDLISKVDNSIKTAMFTALDNSVPEDEDNSDISSLNTSHNSDTFSQLLDQMESHTSEHDEKNKESRSPKEVKVDPTGDVVPPDVKCAELYRRLTGQVTDTPALPRCQDRIRSSQTTGDTGIKKEAEDSGAKTESCLLKKHLLGDIVSLKTPEDKCNSSETNVVEANCQQQSEGMMSIETSSVSGCPVSVKTETISENKKMPLWKKLYKTKEPLPLDVLSKVEKGPVANKQSAFFSDELESFLEKSKDLQLASQKSVKDGVEKQCYSETMADAKELEPDFDEVEGVLFLSFATKDAMDAHISVERKNRWDKDASYLLGVSRLLNLEKDKPEGDSPEQDKSKTPSSLNLRGQHMKWKKYRRMLKEEFETLKLAKERGEPISAVRHFEKTSDITKIKGWRNKFGNVTESDAGKLHWRTEERLLRNLEPTDIKALGIKKKRRKNVVFTHRKGTSKDVGYPTSRTSIYGQITTQEEISDNWDMLMDEYEEPLYDTSGDWGADDSKPTNESSGDLGDISLLSETPDVKDRPFGYAKQTQIKMEFASLFNWGEEELKIIKKLGGRVRNRKKKIDPRDMTSMYTESDSPQVKFRMKYKRVSYTPVSLITEEMALDATCALDFGKYKPSRVGTGCTDNILSKPAQKSASSLSPKRKSPSSVDQKQWTKSSGSKKKRSLTGEDGREACANEHKVEENDFLESTESKSCDKPGCRYGCICYLCQDNPEDVEPKPQDSSQDACNQEYCRLGCICESLRVSQEAADNSHCGKPECMLECVCSKSEEKLSNDEHSSSLLEDNISLDEIPPLIQDPDISADASKHEPAKQEDNDKSTSKTWSRQAKGDKYSNLPKRESRHRQTKTVDAITRKAIMLYRTSEVYCEPPRKKLIQEVSPTNRVGTAKLTSPPSSKQPKSATVQKGMRRKSSVSQDVVQISDEEDPADSSLCARLTMYQTSKSSDKAPPSDPTVVYIERANTNSENSSLNVTPSNSRPNTPVPSASELKDKLIKVRRDSQDSEKQKVMAVAETQSNIGAKVKTSEVLTPAWHTQMVCLKANPKPTDQTPDPKNSEEEEIKLLEFIANCNWDDAKPLILSRVAQCLSRGVYPEPRRMAVGDFIVEILPKADKCAVIPPELRGKLPESMYSIRVKVMKKATEQDIQRFQLKAAITAAKIKQQKSLSKPKDTVSGQSCDSASKRVFKNTTSTALDKNNVFMQSLGKPPSSGGNQVCNAKSSPLGISGLGQLRITNAVSPFMQSPPKSAVVDVKKSEVTKLRNISAVRSMADSEDDMDHITVENTETGACIDMVVPQPLHASASETDVSNDEESSELAKSVKTEAGTSASRDNSWEGAESNLKILKPKIIDQMVKSVLPKPCESSSFEELSDGGGTYEQQCGEDLVTDTKNCLQSGGSKTPAAMQGNGECSDTVQDKLPTSSTATASSTSSSGKPVITQPVVNTVSSLKTSQGKLLIPVSGPGIPTAASTGPKLLLSAPHLAGKPLPYSGPSQKMKTVISTPGGKFYGPFSNFDQMKMFRVRTPDGVTQPLLSLIPAQVVPSASKAKPVQVSNKTPQNPVSAPVDAGTSSVISQNAKAEVSLKLIPHAIPGVQGAVPDITNAKRLKNKPFDQAKKVKRKKGLLMEPKINGIEESTDQVVGMPKKRKRKLEKKWNRTDEVDGCSVETPEVSETHSNSTSTSKLQSSKMQLLAQGKLQGAGQEPLKLRMPSGETIVLLASKSIVPGASGLAQKPLLAPQAGVAKSVSADKENIDGEYCETSVDPLSRGEHDTGKNKASIRQARSSSLESFRTSTPINGGSSNIREVTGREKRQRSDSDSSRYVTYSKRTKLMYDNDSGISSSALVDGSQSLTRVNNSQSPVIEVSDDDDSQMSFDGLSSWGNSSHVSRNQSEDEEFTSEKSSTIKKRVEGARDILKTKCKDASHEGSKQKVKKKSRERERRHDILCMFMYLYNILSKNKPAPSVTLSRQQVLDAAEEAISNEKEASRQLQEELEMQKFFRRAQKRRLRAAVDDHLRSGVPARAILGLLEEVKVKEQKRLAKKRLLRKIIEYGKKKELEAASESVGMNTQKSSLKKSVSKAQSSDHRSGVIHLRHDMETSKCFWQDEFVIEIEGEEEEDGLVIDETTGTESKVIKAVGDQELEEIDVLNCSDDPEAAKPNMISQLSEPKDSPRAAEVPQMPVMPEAIIVTDILKEYKVPEATFTPKSADASEASEKSTLGEGLLTAEEHDSRILPSEEGIHSDVPKSVLLDRDKENLRKLCNEKIESDLCQVDEVASVSGVGEPRCHSDQFSDNNSGISPSMQTSPVLGGNDSFLRENNVELNSTATLQRSNSEEAILQVESFIENAVRQNSVTEEPCQLNDDSQETGKMADDQSSQEQEMEERSVDLKTDCSWGELEAEERQMFESWLPEQVNFDDASADSVPMVSASPDPRLDDSKTPAGVGEVSKNTKGNEQQAVSEISSPTKTNGNSENLFICEVRGHASEEYFCPS